MKLTKRMVAAFAAMALSYATEGMAQNLGFLPFGYNEPWNARLLFNSEGGYNGLNNNVESDIHGWSPLYEAQEGEVLTISMPIASESAENGRVELKTPITVNPTHTYRLKLKLQVDKTIDEAIISLEENEDHNVYMLEKSVRNLSNEAKALEYNEISGEDIKDLKFAFWFATSEGNTTITLSEMSFYDITAKKELWVGTSYYNYCYYRNPQSGNRIKDMQIDGQTETQSWTQSDFDDSMWEEWTMPVGSWGYMDELQSIWPGGDNTNFWIRRDFVLDEVNASTAYFLQMCHDDAYWVYVNGHLVDQDNKWTNGKQFTEIEIPARFLKVGNNVIATYIQQNWGGKFYDCAMRYEEGVYEEGDTDVDYAASVIANEITVANIDQALDHSNNYGAWVELYNKSDKRVSLDYIYVSDDATDMKKFMLPTYGVIPPHGYKCLYFDHHSSDGAYGPNAKKQVNFKLNVDGGTLYLSEDGVKPFLTINYPAAIARCSYARKAVDSEEWGYNGLPTPGAENSSRFANQRLDAPEVSIDSKLFTSKFRIRVTCPEGATLRYTTDGTTPTLDNGETSENGSFTIDNTVIYRFRAFADGYLPSQVVTRSYIYNDKEYYLPVVSVVTDPDNLYDDYVGVYVDGVNGEAGRNHGSSNRNMDWERPVNFEYITAEGEMAVNMEANFAISGGWSRHYLPASFKIKANKVFEGVNSVDYPFFSVKPYNKYKQILIRNGGNDNNNIQHGRVRDAITQKTLISNGFYIDAQDYQPAHVFFNGEYIGQLNIREPNNRFNGTANYGYDDDAMDAYEYSNGYFQMAGTRDAFNQWLTLSENAADPAVYEQIGELVDLDEVINYFAAITYIGCSDWICNNNNSKGYRSLPDGKFHCTLFDQDWGWSNDRAVVQVNNNYGNELLRIYNNMKRNADFRRQFVNSYCILGGSVFTPERCEQIGDSICQLVEKALAMEGRQPWTSFNEQKGQMTSQASRNNRMQALRECYALDEGMDVKLSANIPQAQLMIDKQYVPDSKFDGRLFGPVTITASAPANYRFVGWQNTTSTFSNILQRNEAWRYFDQGSLDGKNWMAADYDDSSWGNGNAPLGYYTNGTRDYNTVIEYGGNASNKYPTYYFRTHFTINNEPTDNDAYTLDYTVDDGCIIYINGVEAFRYLMPEGEVGFNTYATTHAPNNPDSGSLTIKASLLKKGDNVIAVEVHNNSASSTDIYWAASITAKAEIGTIVTASTKNHLLLEDDMSGNYIAVFEPITNTDLLQMTGYTPVCINEVSAGNDIFVNEYIKRDDWIELYNNTDAEIDIEGMYLSDNEKNPTKFQIQAIDGISTIIPAHGRLIVWASKRDPLTQLHAPFKLDNADGSIVSIQPADGSWKDTMRYNEHNGQQSFGRYPDGNMNMFTMSRPTINKPNVLCTYDFDIDDILAENTKYEITYHLNKGWNWFSHNLSSSVDIKSFSPNATEFRDVNAISVLNNGQWEGDLQTLDAAMGYKVNTTLEHDVTLIGALYDIEQPVTLNRGWNLVGCPLYKPTNFDAALANYTPKDNDLITSKYQFAIYSKGEWYGTLTSFTPGQAYFIRTNQPKDFTWNAVTTDRQARRRYAPQTPEETPWLIDDTLYPDVMNLIATVKLDDEALSDNCWIAAFDGDECRGAARLNDGKAFLNVYGNASGNITYKVIDAEGREYTANETSQFKPQNLTGSISSPFVLHISSSMVVGIDDASPYVVSTQYFSLNGQRLSGPINGLHIKRVIMSNGSMIVKKVAK